MIFAYYLGLQRLREAKELADAKAKEQEAFVESRKSNFGAQFDDFQGTFNVL